MAVANEQMEVIDALHKVRNTAAQLQKSFKDGIPSFEAAIPEDEGISLLHAKFATLARYNLNLVKMAHARIKGTDVKSIAETLVEDWIALNKIRPLEKKLKYQMDTLLKNLAKEQLSARPDDERHRPDPSAFVLSDEEDLGNGAADDDVYRPPRIAEVVYDEKDERRKQKEKNEKERFQSRKIRADGVREMLAEVKGKPEEIRDADRDGTMSRSVRRLLKEDDARRQFEEDNFIRLNETRKDKKRRREIDRAMDGPTEDRGDEFGGLEAVADRVLSAHGSSKKEKSKDRNGDAEEHFKVQQLDEITEQMSRTSQGSRKKSTLKKRRKSRR